MQCVHCPAGYVGFAEVCGCVTLPGKKGSGGIAVLILSEKTAFILQFFAESEGETVQELAYLNG